MCRCDENAAVAMRRGRCSAEVSGKARGGCKRQVEVDPRVVTRATNARGSWAERPGVGCGATSGATEKIGFEGGTRQRAS